MTSVLPKTALISPFFPDQHLEDLGIALGDRLKMLRAIRELSSAVSAHDNLNHSRKILPNAAKSR
jgi:hypothetical protein